MEFICKLGIYDKNYCAINQNNRKSLLRVSDKDRLDSKKIEFNIMEKVVKKFFLLIQKNNNVVYFRNPRK